MDPAPIPFGEVDADAVLGVDFLGGEGLFDFGDEGGGLGGGAVEFGFDHGVGREFAGELGEGFAGAGHEVEDHGDAEEGVADGADAEVDDAAVAFAADDGAEGVAL